MTEVEALEMRERLRQHYGCRVAPVSEYCQAINVFFDNAAEYIRGHYPEIDMFQVRHLLIGKSSFLDRLLYGGEKLRTERCPEHKGTWSGLPVEPTPCGCDLTGWLREE